MGNKVCYNVGMANKDSYTETREVILNGQFQ